MRIAIIGGSGFVGSRLISLLQTIPDSKLLILTSNRASSVQT